jgi:hypothetical protein
MKTYTLIGIVLIAMGIVAFAYQGITHTTREKVVKIGPVEVTEKTKTFPLPPIVGAVALAVGILLRIMAGKKVDRALESRTI